MEPKRKQARYRRLAEQLQPLLDKPAPMMSRLATVVAVLHHKMPEFFWTGFYLLHEQGLFVGPYQGPLACQQLAYPNGVCWAGILQNKTLVVPDVHQFPGHIACDSRSNSEIVIPLRSQDGEVLGVLDIDSTSLAAFDDIDARELEAILKMLSQHLL
ncbi:MAG TPA: GAF domain-containing protein [Bacteroidales bacterium]|nr:GAF domain-containing protein [Bacteroidales bacterium]